MRLKTLVFCMLIIYGVFNPINLLGNNQSDSFKFRRFSLELASHIYYNMNDGNGYQILEHRLHANYFNKKYGVHIGATQRVETSGFLVAKIHKHDAYYYAQTMDELLGVLETRTLSYFTLKAGKHFQNKRHIVNIGLSFYYFDKIVETYIRWYDIPSISHYSDRAEYKAMGIGPYFECYLKVKNRVSVSLNYQYNYLFWVKELKKDWEHIEQYRFSSHHFNTFSLKFGILL